MHYIDQYKFGIIRINGISHYNDVIIFPEYIIVPWYREKSHQCSFKDFEPILVNPPELLIIGTGFFGFMKVETKLVSFLLEKGILKVLIKTTKEACKDYNYFDTV